MDIGGSRHAEAFEEEVNRPESFVFVNGRFVSSSYARISVFDHAFQYGDGIYETLVARSGYIFNLERHLSRLRDSASAIGIGLPLTSDELGDLIVECVRMNEFEDAFIKCLVSRGEGVEPIVDHEGLSTTIVIVARKLKAGWDEANAAGIKVHISSVRKVPAASIDPRIKSLNYLPVVLARMEAQQLGFDDALMLDLSGRVVEGSIYNIFIIRNGSLVTPPHGALEGITRESVFILSAESGLPANTGEIWPNDIYLADEIFFCNTSRGILPVVEVNRRPIGLGEPGPITMKLRNLYLNRLKSGWLGTSVAP